MYHKVKILSVLNPQDQQYLQNIVINSENVEQLINVLHGQRDT